MSFAIDVETKQVGLVLGVKAAQVRYTSRRYGVSIRVAPEVKGQRTQRVTIEGTRAYEASESLRKILNWAAVAHDKPRRARVYAHGDALVRALYPSRYTWDHAHAGAQLRAMREHAELAVFWVRGEAYEDAPPHYERLIADLARAPAYAIDSLGELAAHALRDGASILAMDTRLFGFVRKGRSVPVQVYALFDGARWIEHRHMQLADVLPPLPAMALPSAPGPKPLLDAPAEHPVADGDASFDDFFARVYADLPAGSTAAQRRRIAECRVRAVYAWCSAHPDETMAQLLV